MTESTTDDERVQAALDAALDDMDSDEEEEETVPVVMGPPRPPPTSNGDDDVDGEEQLAQMMQQLLFGEQGNDGVGDMLGHLEAEMKQKAPELDGATLEEMMERLAQNQSERAANTSREDPDADEAMLKNLMGELGGEGGADLLIQGMMEDLLSKELMYEPMQHVVERFPAWLEKHEATLDAAELKRRQAQYACFRKIVKVYEQPSCEDMGSLLELMQEVQEFGQPPIEIIQDISPGIELDDDGNPKLPFLSGEGDNDECCIS